MGNSFHNDSPIVSFLSMLGNMMLVSCFWCLTCLGIVTIVPSCSAGYFSSAKVIRGNGTHLASAYFSSFKQNFKQGWVFSLVFLVGAFVLYTCLDFGSQMSHLGWGFAYFIAMIIVSLLVVCTAVYIPLVISRFDVKSGAAVRLSMYFAMMYPGKTILLVALLVICVFLVWFSSGILMMFAPGGYFTLATYLAEKSFKKYMIQLGLVSEEEAEIETLLDPTYESAISQAKSLELRDDSDNTEE